MNMTPKTLEIDVPVAKCGHCGFVSSLSGKWSVEDSQLVWRGNADLQPGRGPDLFSCCESREVTRFERMTVQEGPPLWKERELSAEDLAALRASASEGQAEWGTPA